MSDMWQVPEGLAESLLTPDPCADERYEGYLNGVQAGKEYIGNIVVDSLAELRDACEDWQLEWLHALAATIEERLKEAINE